MKTQLLKQDKLTYPNCIAKLGRVLIVLLGIVFVFFATTITLPQVLAANYNAALTVSSNYPQGLNYKFNCDVSDFTPTSYSWDFGDGAIETSSANNIIHIYDVSGTYTTLCTATDNANNASGSLLVRASTTTNNSGSDNSGSLSVTSSAGTIGSSSAVINERSGVQATFTVFYGINDLTSSIDGGYGQSQTATISSLDPNTNYRYLVQGCDNSNNCQNSSSSTFTTLSNDSSSGSSNIASIDSNSSTVNSMNDVALSTTPKKLALTDGGSYYFLLPNSSTGHTVSVDSLGDNTATLLFDSTVDVTINTGEEKTVSLVGDNAASIQLKAQTITTQLITFSLGMPIAAPSVSAPNQTMNKTVQTSQLPALNKTASNVTNDLTGNALMPQTNISGMTVNATANNATSTKSISLTAQTANKSGISWGWIFVGVLLVIVAFVVIMMMTGKIKISLDKDDLQR